MWWRRIGRVVGYGFVLWAVPLTAALALTTVRETHRPLFESLMALVLAACAVVQGNRFLSRSGIKSRWRAVTLGLIWAGMGVSLDLPLFSWGPMKMTIVAYLRDIGVTYLIYPIVMAGLYRCACERPCRAE
jgi:hypothetical protein